MDAQTGNSTKRTGPKPWKSFSDMEASEAYAAYYTRDLSAIDAAAELDITPKQVVYRAKVWKRILEAKTDEQDDQGT